MLYDYGIHSDFTITYIVQCNVVVLIIGLVIRMWFIRNVWSNFHRAVGIHVCSVRIFEFVFVVVFTLVKGLVPGSWQFVCLSVASG